MLNINLAGPNDFEIIKLLLTFISINLICDCTKRKITLSVAWLLVKLNQTGLGVSLA